MSLLVVSAVEFEVEASLKVLRKQGVKFEYFGVGIGPLHAAKSEARLKEASRGKTVLYIGTCGSFYPFEKPHLVTVDSVYWMPPCLRTGIAGFPEHLYPCVRVPQSSLPLPTKSVLTTPSVSLISDFSPEIQKKVPMPSTLVENMELYSCVEGLLEANYLHILLGVTNGIGPEARKEWRANFQVLADMTAEFLERNSLEGVTYA